MAWLLLNYHLDQYLWLYGTYISRNEATRPGKNQDSVGWLPLQYDVHSTLAWYMQLEVLTVFSLCCVSPLFYKS